STLSLHDALPICSIEHLPQRLRSKDVVLAVARADAQRLESASPHARLDLFAESFVPALPVHDSCLFFPPAGRLPHAGIDAARTDAALAAEARHVAVEVERPRRWNDDEIDLGELQDGV